MKFYSLTNPEHQVSFREAVINGIAPDKGLYFPQRIQPLPTSFFKEIGSFSRQEIAMQAMQQFVGTTISSERLYAILDQVLDFDFPMVSLEENIAVLELFHGPTMAFKDVGARFMAHCLGHFSAGSQEEVTVLVATSGDTGGAVANGFLGVPGVQVVILYPSGKVSQIQEKQLTTLGQNITALEVAGTFDDCQQMVKKAFLDKDIQKSKRLTSANSINVARWLPQLLYFLFAFKEAESKDKAIVFAVPSGNFGNICAGIVAKKLGMPAHHFVAATNSNDVVPHYMDTGKYQPKPAKATISNAMDVGDPSNFVRILKLFDNDFTVLSKYFSSYSFSDEATKATMQELYTTYGYLADPHGAVGYLGLKQYLRDHPDCYGIFLETAHPVKFLPVVEATLGIIPEIPPQIQKVMTGEKSALAIATYNELKTYLLKS
ncbi:MAG: threonine synthase [Bacteroidota bacterium]